MSSIEKSTWLLLDSSDKLKLISDLLSRLDSKILHEQRTAKKQLLDIINWLDETYD